MTDTPTPSPDAALPVWTHTDLKTRGPRALSEQLLGAGGVVLMNHGRKTGVVLSMAEFERLTALAREAERLRAELPDPIDLLRQRFDERLEMLRRRGAPERLDAAFEANTRDMGLMCEPPLLAG